MAAELEWGFSRLGRPRFVARNALGLVDAGYRPGIVPFAPVRPGVGADHAAAGADHARPERRDRDRFREPSTLNTTVRGHALQ